MSFNSPFDIDSFNEASKQLIADVRKPNYEDFVRVLTYLSENDNEHQIFFFIDINTFSNEKYTQKVLSKLLEKKLIKAITLSPLIEDKSISTVYKITSKGKFYLAVKWNEFLNFLSKNRKQIIVTFIVLLVIILFFVFIEEIKEIVPSETQFYGFLDKVEKRSGTIQIVLWFIGGLISYLVYKKSNK